RYIPSHTNYTPMSPSHLSNFCTNDTYRSLPVYTGYRIPTSRQWIYNELREGNVRSGISLFLGLALGMFNKFNDKLVGQIQVDRVDWNLNLDAGVDFVLTQVESFRFITCGSGKKGGLEFEAYLRPFDLPSWLLLLASITFMVAMF